MFNKYIQQRGIPIAAMDAGKFNFRFLDHRNIVFRFRTKLKEVQTVPPKMEYIKYKGKIYRVGDAGSNSDFNPSKMTLVHQLNIYYALIKNGYSGVKTNLVLGTPLKYFNNPEINEEFSNFIKQDGNVIVEYQGKEHTIIINDILILPESSGIIFNGKENYEKFSNKYIGIVDIGGLNAQGCIYSFGVPQEEFIMDSELGSFALILNIKDTVNSQYPRFRFQDKEIESFIQIYFNKGETVPEDKQFVYDIIEGCMEEHLEKILESCRKKQWNLEFTDIVFTGGCSSLMSSFIKSKGYEVSDDCLNDNVRGFYDLAIAHFGQKCYEEEDLNTQSQYLQPNMEYINE